MRCVPPFSSRAVRSRPCGGDMYQIRVPGATAATNLYSARRECKHLSRSHEEYGDNGLLQNSRTDMLVLRTIGGRLRHSIVIGDIYCSSFRSFPSIESTHVGQSAGRRNGYKAMYVSGYTRAARVHARIRSIPEAAHTEGKSSVVKLYCNRTTLKSRRTAQAALGKS